MAREKKKRTKRSSRPKTLRISENVKEAARSVAKAVEDLCELSRKNASGSFCFNDCIECVFLRFADARSVGEGIALLATLLPEPDAWFRGDPACPRPSCRGATEVSREGRGTDNPATHTRTMGGNTIRTPVNTIMGNRLTDVCIHIAHINTGLPRVDIPTQDWKWVSRYGQLLRKCELEAVEFPEIHAEDGPPGLSECQAALEASVKAQIDFLRELERKPTGKRKTSRIGKGDKSNKPDQPAQPAANVEPQTREQAKDEAQKLRKDPQKKAAFVITVKSPTYILVNGKRLSSKPQLDAFRALALLSDRLGPDGSLFFSTQQFVTKIKPELKGEGVSRPWLRYKKILKKVCPGIVIEGKQGEFTVRGLKFDMEMTFEEFKRQWEARLSDSTVGNHQLPTPP